MGQQVERLFNTAPRDQVHVILYDDFKADTRGCYERVLAFLGLPVDGGKDFGARNTHRRHRIGLLAEIDYQLRAPPPRPRRLKHRVQDLLGVDSLRLHRIVNRINQTINLSHAPRPLLSAAMEAELQGYFAEDTALLSRLLQRDLSHWLRGKAPTLATSGQAERAGS